MENQLPGWVQSWFIFSGLICTWDASFVLLRPHTLPGGKYSSFYKPYELYIAVDKRYADMNDTFVMAQSWMNLVEVFLGFYAIFCSWRRCKSTLLVAFFTASLTAWKTVAYFLLYVECLCGGGEYHSHNSFQDNFLFLYLPCGIWITVPLFVVISIWSRISAALSNLKTKKTL